MKKFKRLFAALVAAAMMMALCCVSAFAADLDATSQGTDAVTITKNVVVPAGVTAPESTFTFDVVSTDTDSTYKTQKTITIKSNETTGTADLTNQDLKALVPSGKTPGVYTFTVKETSSTPVGKWSAGNEEYTLTINKYNDETVTAYLVKNGSTTKTDNAVFENTYTDNMNLEVSKNAKSEGTLIKDKDYEIEITITNPSTGNQFDGSIKAKVNGTGQEYEFESGKATKVILKAGDKITLENLPVGTTYKVEEVGSKGADTKYNVTIGSTPSQSTAAVTGTLTDGTAVEVYNEYATDNAATGVLTRIMPFVAMIVAAGAAAAAYFVIARKRRAED